MQSRRLVPADQLNFASRTKQQWVPTMVISMQYTIINPGPEHAKIQI
jgi:hypothetical protein